MSRPIRILGLALGLPLVLGFFSPPVHACREVKIEKDPEIMSAVERVRMAQKWVGPELAETIQDADFREEPRGDDRFGPADRVLFLRLQVRKEDLPAWKRHLAETSIVKEWPQPKVPVPWWPMSDHVKDFSFLALGSLFRGRQGFAAINPSGSIFLYAFTS